MNNLLQYPASTIVDRVIPKNAFYRNANITPRMRSRFVEELQELRWLYKLAPQSLNVERGKDIEEIEIFHASLKQSDVPIELLQFIDKTMPQFIVFILQYQDRYCLYCNYKQFTTQAHDKCDIKETFVSDWHTDIPSLAIQGRSLSAIYDNFVRQIAGTRLEQTSTAPLEQAVQAMQQRDALLKEIERIEKAIQHEPQFNRQVALNQRLKQLRKQLEQA
jgi:hypothetical protein